jgi:hypothetical protein
MNIIKHQRWEPQIRHLIATCSDNVRNSRRTTGRKPRVGGFETSDLNLEWQALAHFVATLLGGLDYDDEDDDEDSAIPRGVDWFDCNKAAMFMTDFFKDISKECYTFLLEDEGSHPSYGRTGRTSGDPHASVIANVSILRTVKPAKPGAN